MLSFFLVSTPFSFRVRSPYGTDTQTDRQTEGRTGKTRNAAYWDGRIINKFIGKLTGKVEVKDLILLVEILTQVSNSAVSDVVLRDCLHRQFNARLYDILGFITSPGDGQLGWFLGRRVFRSKG